MSRPSKGVLTQPVRAAKRALLEAGIPAGSLRSMIAMALDRLRMAEEAISEAKAALREHGVSPNGKRLGAAVDEGLRLAKRGDLG